MKALRKRAKGKRTIIILLLPLLFAALSAYADNSPPAGPLRVHAGNGRYFANAEGEILYLTGAHTWMVFQTQEDHSFDFDDWLKQFVSWDHNFMRGWHWEDGYYSPLPYKQIDGKYDLTKYNDEYFKRLRRRIELAGRQEPPVYISVMLFQGWSAVDKKKYRSPNPWPRHPYNPANNVNGIDGKLEKSHELHDPEVTALQEAYVKHTIDVLNDLDNIIWEISNESHPESWEWQQHMVRVIKKYEAKKPKQHLVWVNVAAPDYEAFMKSPADIVSPSGNIYQKDPPASTGRKIVIADSDHQGPLTVTHAWVWKNFTRGNLPILMDCKYQPKISWWGGRNFQPEHPKWDHMRNALGATRRLAGRIDLAAMAPQAGGGHPASTAYCLFSSDAPMSANPAPNGNEFVVYAPGKGSPVTLFGLTPQVTYRFEWTHPITGKSLKTAQFKAAGVSHKFVNPSKNLDTVLHVYR